MWFTTLIDENKTFFLSLAGIICATYALYTGQIMETTYAKMWFAAIGGYTARTVADKAFVKKK